jgi:uncharacterized protein
MFSLQDGEKAVTFARSVLHATVEQNPIPLITLPSSFQKNHGVFTTLQSYPSFHLRGCIGIPEPVMTLKDAIVESARSVTHDPRFPVLQAEELSEIVVEITILTTPEEIKVDNPKDIIKNIQVGRDGLIIEQGFYKGLLLPQVPIEQRWDTKIFVEQTCLKAGLPKDAWLEKKTIIKTFTGQIFTEEKPFGYIKEKPLDES